MPPYDRRHGPWNLDMSGAELADDEDRSRVDWRALTFTLDALKEAPAEDHAMLIGHARREAKGDPEALALVEAAVPKPRRTLRDIHAELEAHVAAGTLTPEIGERLLAEERAMSPGGVLECGVPWMLAGVR